MVRLIRRYEDREYRTEAKQVGTLYHVCTPESFAKYIIPNNELQASGEYTNYMLDNRKDVVSFTRDPLFVVPSQKIKASDILFQIVVDGDRLSEHYKVFPYNDFAEKGEEGEIVSSGTKHGVELEKEEDVIGPIKNFKSYIKEVRFDCRNIYKNDLMFLEDIKTYLGSIPCRRVTLPRLDGFWRHTYKKRKGEEELYNIKTLDELIDAVRNSGKDSPFIKLDRAFREDDPDAWNNALSELHSDGLFFDYEYPSLEECVKNNKPRIFRNLYKIQAENADMFDDLVYAIISIFNILKNKDRDVFIDMLIDMLDCSLDEYFTANDFHFIISRINNKADKEAFREIFTIDDKRKYEDREYRTESKQVGTLYHVCTLDAFVNRIIEDKEKGTKNNLHASGKYKNTLLNTHDAVSFTRDSLFVVPTWTVGGSNILFQFVVDGDKLSEHYKITPYQARDWTQDRPTWSEKEEVVIGPIKNFKSYIKEVHFDIKSLSPTDLSKLAEPLKEVEEYLGSIPCTRTTLPYHTGDNRHDFKKFKNIQYEIKTLNELISYIENLDDIKVSDYDDHLVNMIDSIDLFGKYYDDLSEEQVTDILKKHPEWLKKEDVFQYIFDGDNIDLIKLILDKVKNPNIKDSEGKNLLFYTDNIEIIKLLLDSGIDVDAKDKYGNTALLKACINGTPEKVKLLLEHGADINVKDKMGFSPLLNSMRNHRDVAKLLLELGANPNVKDDDGETPLMWSSSSRNIKKAKLLLDYGADVNVKNKDGLTALDMVSYSDIDMAKLLIEHGADVNNISKDDITLLIRACYHNLDMVKFLVEHGADVNMQSNSGMSPLLSACAFNKNDIASYLLAHGADPNADRSIGDKDLSNPLVSAVINENKALVDILLKYGANPYIKYDGKPLIESVKNNSIKDSIQKAMDNWKGKRESFNIKRLYRR